MIKEREREGMYELALRNLNCNYFPMILANFFEPRDLLSKK